MVTPLPVWIHMLSALAALALGTLLFSRRIKGDRLHRVAGWTWVALMLAVAVSSLWIPRFLTFSWIHVFTLVTLVGIPQAVLAIRRGNVAAHRAAMRNLFVWGLVVAGLFALIPGRRLGNAMLALLG